MKPKSSSSPEGDAPAAAEAAEFVAFVQKLTNAELASVYSGYRFLAELGYAGDAWKRDICKAQLDARFAGKPTGE
jgi:hypothetical protein